MKIFLILLVLVLVILFPAHALMLGIGLFALALFVGLLGLLIIQIRDFSRLFSDKQY